MKLQHTPKAELFTQLIVESFRLNAHFMASGDALIQDMGLTSARWQVLHTIDSAPLPVAQIARQLHITRQSVLRTVNTLQKKGFVAMRDNPNHQRAKLVELLDEGRKKLEAARLRHVSWANKQAEHLDMAKLQITVEFMQWLRTHNL